MVEIDKECKMAVIHKMEYTKVRSEWLCVCEREREREEIPGVILFLLCTTKNRPGEAQKIVCRAYYSFIRLDDL